MMRKLYEIDKDIERLLDEDSILKIEGGQAVDTESGEVFSLTERLESLQIERTRKLESVAFYLDDINIKLARIDERIKQMQALKKSLQNQEDRLGSYLLYATQNAGIETDNVRVKVSKSVRTEIVDEDAIPQEYKIVKTKTEPDKTAIKKAIKSGEAVPGAELKEYYSISII
jgi:hypothetical protein